MTTHTRRYVFIDFETLTKIKFRKLEKVCDKLFVFVSSEIESVPFPLVKDIQKMGNAVKWIEVGGMALQDLNYHICFLMGKLHEKISSDVEFAILSNDDAFDPLVNFINSTGRNCLRVKQQITETNEEKPVVFTPKTESPKAAEPPKAEKEVLGARLFGERQSETHMSDEGSSDRTIVDETASETVRRLIRSGNRPADLNMLKSYILLHNQEMSLHGNVDKVIAQLKENDSIHVEGAQVVYNF
jgi:PIN domain